MLKEMAADDDGKRKLEAAEERVQRELARRVEEEDKKEDAQTGQEEKARAGGEGKDEEEAPRTTIETKDDESMADASVMGEAADDGVNSKRRPEEDGEDKAEKR